MNRKQWLAFIALGLLSIVSTTFAYEFLGNVTGVQKEARGVLVKCGSDAVRLDVLAPNLIRVRLARNGIWDDSPSYAVIKNSWPDAEWGLSESAGELTVETAELKVKIKRRPCRISFYDKEDRLINQDDEAFGIGWDGPEVGVYKKLFDDEKFYGLGEKTGRLNKRGDEWVMWNSDFPGYDNNDDPLYQSHPFFIGVRQFGKKENATATQFHAYGIFFDNTYRTFFNMGAGNRRFYSFRAERGTLDYYFIHGPSIKKILQRYTELVGRMPLPPMWALGYQQCRWSYYPESTVLTLAKNFRDKKIPCDVIYLDIHYMDGYRCFTWDKNRFPDPKKMLANLAADGFKVVTIVDPGIKVDPGYFVYEEGLKGNHFVKYPDGQPYVGEVWPGPSHFTNYTVPASRAWWGSLHKNFLDQGIAGFWNDMNEPAVWGRAVPDVVEFDENGKKVSQKKIHNVFGSLMAQTTYEGVRKLQPNRRPFILTRAGFAGIQRYSAVWTGDNVANAENLEMAIRMCQGMGLSGVPFVGSDVGGFFDTPKPELYARWIQAGVFTPFLRTHTVMNSSNQEPWSFGDQVEEISRNYISLRYRLMPYLYTAFKQSSDTGVPVMRPLFLEFPDDPECYQDQNNLQYFFGDDLLVAPVTQMGSSLRKVYLPAGRWTDFWSEKIYEGGQYLIVEAPLEQLPLFVRAGGMIFSREVQQYIGEKPMDKLIVDLYPAPMSTRILYEDDGASFDYEKGLSCETAFTISMPHHQSLNIEIGERKGAYIPAARTIQLRVHEQASAPKAVTIDGASVEKNRWQFDVEKQIVEIGFADDGKQHKVDFIW
jgi:alpha-glucosidase